MAGLGARHRREAADEALVRRLFDEHGYAMLAYAIRLTGDRGIAEGVFQEALVRAWRNPDGLANGKCWARKWLLGMVGRLVDDTPERPSSGVPPTRPHVATHLSDLPLTTVSRPKFPSYRTWRLTGVTRRRWP
jgi:hypothetical protein